MHATVLNETGAISIRLLDAEGHSPGDTFMAVR